eukprot:7274973-Pyramimonas_sp.AAC.1
MPRARWSSPLRWRHPRNSGPRDAVRDEEGVDEEEEEGEECFNMPCQPALDGHAIDLGNRSGSKNPVWGYCTPAIMSCFVLL